MVPMRSRKNCGMVSQLQGHRKPSWIGGKLVKHSRKDVCTWETKKPNWRDLWAVGMCPSRGGLGGCTRLLPHTEGGSCHRSPEMLPQQLQPRPQLQWGSKLPSV